MTKHPIKNKPILKTIRLNRYLAKQGVASRRKADNLIVAGRVEVQGKIIRELGFKISKNERDVCVDGVPLDPPSNKNFYFALNKPKNVVTTLSDPEGRPTVADFLPSTDTRIFPVGRLDFDAEGILLMTNDGDLAHKLTHPKFEVKKTYSVKVKGKPTHETLTKLRKGLRLEDGFAKPLFVELERTTQNHSWIKVTINEGRNHLIKRMWLRVGHPVIKLIRKEFAGITAKNLRFGEIRPLSKREIAHLLALNHQAKV